MRFVALILVNIALIPIFVLGFVLMFALTFTPIFPARVALQNIRERLGMQLLEAHILAAKSLFHYFVYLIEIVVIWPLGLTQVSNSAETEAWIEDMAQKYGVREAGMGFAFLAPHFGSIEVVGQHVGAILQKHVGQGVVALAQPSRVPGITALSKWYRARRGIDTVLTESKTLFGNMSRIVLSGYNIGLLVDQKPRRGGVFIDFFGSPAAFPHRGLGTMIENKIPVLCAASVRIFPGYFRHVFSDTSNPHLGLKNSTPFPQNTLRHTPSGVNPATAQLLTEFAAWLETEVRKNPQQWCWDYRKWSRQVPTVK